MTTDVELSADSAEQQWQRRLQMARDTHAYQAYLQVRRQVIAQLGLGHDRRSGSNTPSDYWSGELSRFDYMLDASPLVIAKLRHHTHNLTGLLPQHYRGTLDAKRQQFAEKLNALHALDNAGLWLPEAPLLGGFGFDVNGALVNIDTLKFYEVLIALQRGAVLSEFREATERRLVWEIGAGWGGFAYQFKTLCPNVTYVITDFPELFLFSATYLLAAFPDARVRFYGEVPPGETFADWDGLDFVFLPNTFHTGVRPERVDLTINMVSFQEMTTQQVEAYVQHAYQLDCPYLYSLNRDRSHHNHELSNVRSIIADYYWPHEVKVLPVSYPKMLDAGADLPRSGYKHVVGWRRVRR